MSSRAHNHSANDSPTNTNLHSSHQTNRTKDPVKTNHPTVTSPSSARPDASHILAHAQLQFQQHLTPPKLSWYPGSKSTPRAKPMSRSSTAHASHSALLPSTHLPVRWWDGGEGDGGGALCVALDSEEDVVTSIERDDASPVGPRTGAASSSTEEDCLSGVVGGEDEDARVSDEDAQVSDEDTHVSEWNGYVRHKESWLRRAGLKRGVEEEGGLERRRSRKKGRVIGQCS